MGGKQSENMEGTYHSHLRRRLPGREEVGGCGTPPGVKAPVVGPVRPCLVGQVAGHELWAQGDSCVGNRLGDLVNASWSVLVPRPISRA